MWKERGCVKAQPLFLLIGPEKSAGFLLSYESLAATETQNLQGQLSLPEPHKFLEKASDKLVRRPASRTQISSVMGCVRAQPFLFGGSFTR